MANSTYKLSAADKARQKREQEEQLKQQQKKKNRVITLSILGGIVVLAIILCIFLIPKSNKEDFTQYMGIYTNGEYNITLKKDGTFTATLPHDVSYQGKYSVNNTAITFTVDGQQHVGTLTTDTLTIPGEWDDGHGHASTFTRQSS